MSDVSGYAVCIEGKTYALPKAVAELIDGLDIERKRLRDALEVYGNEDHWIWGGRTEQGYPLPPEFIYRDATENPVNIARQALYPENPPVKTVSPY